MLHVHQPAQDHAPFARWPYFAEFLPGFSRAKHLVAQPREVAGVRNDWPPVCFRSFELLGDHRFSLKGNAALKPSMHLLLALKADEHQGNSPGHEPNGEPEQRHVSRIARKS